MDFQLPGGLAHVVRVSELDLGWAVYLCLLQLRLEALAVEEGGLGPRHRCLRQQHAWA